MDENDLAFPYFFTTAALSTRVPCTKDNAIETFYTLRFQDCPQLPNEGGAFFTTSLVGVLPSGAPSAPLFTWQWASNYDGTTGGVTQLKSTYPPYANLGTGGVTVTSINGVQLPTPVPSSQVTTTASGLAYSRVSQTFNGTVTLTNISSNPISGPLEILFLGITDGVTLANETGNLSGTPYLTVPAVDGLASGQSVIVGVQFKNPSNVTINFTPAIYSGNI